MFNKNLQPIYDGKVLVNQSAMDNPVVQAALAEMSRGILNLKKLITTECGTSQIGTNYERSNQ